jgi:hypothetical protein
MMLWIDRVDLEHLLTFTEGDHQTRGAQPFRGIPDTSWRTCAGLLVDPGRRLIVAPAEGAALCISGPATPAPVLRWEVELRDDYSPYSQTSAS